MPNHWAGPNIEKWPFKKNLPLLSQTCGKQEAHGSHAYLSNTGHSSGPSSYL